MLFIFECFCKMSFNLKNISCFHFFQSIVVIFLCYFTGPLSYSLHTYMDNPFAALKTPPGDKADRDKLSRVFEAVLETRVSLSSPSKYLYVDCLPGENPAIDGSTVQQVVFERLMLDGGGHKKGLLFYLFESFFRAKEHLLSLDEPSYLKCIEALTLNTATAFLTPDLISNGSESAYFRQIISLTSDMYISYKNEMVEFIRLVVASMEQQSTKETCSEFFQRLARFIGVRLKKKPGDIASTSLLCVLGHCGPAAQALIAVSTPDKASPRRGRMFEESLIGNLLSTGALSDPEIANSYFANPRRLTSADLSATNQHLWSLTSRCIVLCFDLFYAILKSSEDAKRDLLHWLAQAIDVNKAGRNAGFDGGISQLAFFGSESGKCSDGFLVNLLAVFAKLAKPFSKPWDHRFISISPNSNGSCVDFSSETKMTPSGDTDANDTPSFPQQPPPFRAELFYLTHACMSAGYRRVIERFFHQAQQLQRLTDTHEAVESGRMQMSREQVELLQTNIEIQMRSYLTVRSCLFEPTMCQDLVVFLTSTTCWLVSHCLDVSSQADLKVDAIVSANRSSAVSLIPELVAENIVETFLFWKRFHVGINREILLHLSENAEHVLSFALVFMGARERLNNPHLRAKLADLLEVLVVPPPPPSSGAMSNFDSSGFDLSVSSNQHRLAAAIIPVVLSVFVSIEMTGQGVNFYEKFSYRRAIYAIIHHCCSLELHKTQLNSLADASIAEYDVALSDEPPLFLRFVNLMINDAIYLLDEALGMLVQIRQQQEDRNAGQWDQLSYQQRQSRVGEYDFLLSQCRTLNILARETIRGLSLVTSLVPAFFTHFSLDDRIAAMANYFLLHLVGPKQREFKVENMHDVDFKPDALVQSICSIYTNLGHLEQFRIAVVSDGRSFSEDLLKRASRILDRIHASIDEIERFDEVSKLIMGTTKQVEDEEEIAAEAPEEFLDPILGTLMHDPVMLPASNVTVDRSVIVRHLLSDQLDPFNRAPLTVDQLVPMPELRGRIEDWLKERRQLREENGNDESKN